MDCKAPDTNGQARNLIQCLFPYAALRSLRNAWPNADEEFQMLKINFLADAGSRLDIDANGHSYRARLLIYLFLRINADSPTFAALAIDATVLTCPAPAQLRSQDILSSLVVPPDQTNAMQRPGATPSPGGSLRGPINPRRLRIMPFRS
ncbi:hypothetical protein CMUS01_06141 [Colletotrichum musicola]|uniref:Uncharacterized protein n=1 Tax=Colletotrichum musicola TaxID=2175873 RepID=A0A8H6KMY6_9PEZI|nr:hypothetical protein CMUS01_06141 [Colletotrichum musicola]